MYIYVYNDMLGYWSEGIFTVVIHKGFTAGHKAWFQHIHFTFIDWLTITDSIINNLRLYNLQDISLRKLDTNKLCNRYFSLSRCTSTSSSWQDFCHKNYKYEMLHCKFL